MRRIVFTAATVAIGLGVGAVGSAVAKAEQEDAGLKAQVCNAVGCPDTDERLCAEVSGKVKFPFFEGTVNYQCYEPVH